MKKTTMALAIASLALMTGFAMADHHGTQTFEGKYDWSDGGNEALTAEFEPDGEGTWKVKFDFRWNGQDHTWIGTAEGSLEDGSEMTGTATSGSRNWVFEARIEKGVMQGAHREIRDGRDPYESGSFQINRN